MTARPRIVIADDHTLTCEGLRALLEPDHEVVAVVHDGRQVLHRVQETAPDLVLLDLAMPGRHGLEVLRDLEAECPAVHVVMLTMHADAVYVDEAIRAGAEGYLLKLATGSELALAIRTVLTGERYVTPHAGTTAQHRPRTALPPPPLPGMPPEITERQRQVLALVARGMTNAQIAEALAIGPKGVEYHRARIREVLKLSSNAALVRWAVHHGVIAR